MCSPSTLKVPSTGSPCWRKRGLSPQSAAQVSGGPGAGGGLPPEAGLRRARAGRPSVLGLGCCARSSLQAKDVSSVRAEVRPRARGQASSRPRPRESLLRSRRAQSLLDFSLELGVFIRKVGWAPSQRLVRLSMESRAKLLPDAVLTGLQTPIPGQPRPLCPLPSAGRPAGPHAHTAWKGPSRCLPSGPRES